MLPSLLTGTYKQYKKDTDDIATWLATTAKRIPHQQREYVIPIKEFLSLAAFIAGHIKAPFKVPHSALSTLKRAIEARRKSNLWFRTNESNDGSDEGHAHFIGILEEVHEILKPHSSPLTESATDSDVDVDNLFANLQLEELSQASSSTPGPERAATQPATRIKYEAEPMQNLSEMMFASFSLFNDVSKIHSFLENLWAEYHKGAIDLVTVSITSNTAIDIIRRLEQEFFEQFSSAKDPEQLINMMFQLKCLSQGVRPHAKPAHMGSIPFNIDMYDTAQFLFMDTLTFLSSFANVVTPNHISVHKPGFFGTYNPKADRTKMSSAQKFEEDKIIYTAILTDFCFLAKFTKNIPAEDELTRGIRIMVNDQKLHIWTLFAARLFVDVHHLLRTEVGTPFKQLQSLGKSLKSSWAETIKIRDNVHLPNWPPQNDMVVENGLIKLIDEWLFQDPIQISMERIVRSIPVPKGEFRLFRQHPLLCGLFAFSLLMRAQEYGVTYANAWGATLYMGHLYNAVQQESYCKAPWMDMEILIGMQTPEKMFVGGKPTDPDGYMKRFALSIGYSAEQYARNRRRQDAVASRAGPCGLVPVGQVSTILRDRYCENADLHDWSLETVEKILNAKYEVDVDASEGEVPVRVVEIINLKARNKQEAKEHLRKKVKQNTQLSPTELLYALSVSILREAPLLSFDFFGLHRTCWGVLHVLQEALHEQLLKYYGSGYLETESQLPFIVAYIFMTASQSQKASEQLPEFRKMLGDAKVGSKLLMSAGSVLENLMTDEKWGPQMDAQVRKVAEDGRILFPVPGADGKKTRLGTKIDLGDYELVYQGNRQIDHA